jgi:RNA polymerase sigma-70 factor, ECF subfamily
MGIAYGWPAYNHIIAQFREMRRLTLVVFECRANGRQLKWPAVKAADAPASGREAPILQPARNFAKSRSMTDPSAVTKGRTQKTPATPGPATRGPATLGEVLYAKSKAPVPEQDWATLVRSMAAGDQLALHTLYEMAHRMVFTLIMRITANRETAEELTIDVFHDVWRRASRYDAANGTVLGWIMNQARSRAIDRLRFESRQKRSRGEDAEPLAEIAAEPRDALELRAEAQSLRVALATLTPNERQAIETTFFGGLTHAEAAARLNQPLGTIKTRIRSGLHKLRRALAAESQR